MSLPVSFRRAAQTEFVEASAWYAQHHPKLGADFVAEIERCVAQAARHPLLFADLHKGIRRVLAARFPYSVYFRLEARRIVVLAVFHASRNPAIWHQRV